MRRVTSIPGTYTVGAHTVGPFEASVERPYTEAPDALVLALGLPLHDSDPQLLEERAAQAQAAATLAEGEGSVDLEQLRAELDDLKADKPGGLPWLKRSLDSSERERLDVLRALERVTGERDEARGKVAQLERERDGLLMDLAASLKREDAAIQQSGTDAPEPHEGGASAPETPLPDDFPSRALLAEAGFDTVEKVRTGLLTNENQEVSPIASISGIGPATLDKIKAALP